MEIFPSQKGERKRKKGATRILSPIIKAPTLTAEHKG
jgi:hypothetical protein